MKLLTISVIQSSLLGSIVFAFLLLFKQIAQKRCGAKIWHHFIMITVVLYVIPILFSNRILYSVVQPIHQWLRVSMLRITGYQPNVVYREVLSTELLFVGLFWTWLLGAIVYLVVRGSRNSISTIRLKKGLKTASSKVHEIFNSRFLTDKRLNKLGRLRHIELYFHSELFTPVFYGFLHKNIVLPMKSIENYGVEDIYLMLRHEVMHMVHRDSWKRLFLLLVQAINWFNPLLFLLESNINEALEIYCDHETIENKSDSQMRFQYSDLLISMINTNHYCDVNGLSLSGKSIMEKRLTFTMQEPKKPEKAVTGMIAFCICIIVLISLVIFTESNNYKIREVTSGVVDTGESASSEERPSQDNAISKYNLSEQGEQIFELYLDQGDVHYIPATFSTLSSRIAVSLLTKDCQVQVYIYNSTNTNYPLMQIDIYQYSEPQAFSGLSTNHVYLLGVISKQVSDEHILLSISD